MATTVHEPPKIEERASVNGRESGNGGWQNLVPADGDRRVALDYSPPPARTGIWVVVVRHHDDVCCTDQRFGRAQRLVAGLASFTLPSILYLNTALLLGSSVTLEIARRRVARIMGGLAIPGESPARWLYITLS